MKKYALLVLFVAMIAVGFALRRAYVHDPALAVAGALRQAAGAAAFTATVTAVTFAPESVLRAAGADPTLALLPVVVVADVAVHAPKDGPASWTADASFADAADDGTGGARIAVIASGGSSYVRFENLPSGQDGKALADALSGRWLSLSSADAAALLGKQGTLGAADGAAWARVRAAALDGSLFGLPRELGGQVIDGMPTRRYAVPLRPDVLPVFLQDVSEALSGRTLSSDERAAIAQDAAGRDVALTVWVDRRTGRLLQFSVEAAKPGSSAPVSVLARITAWDAPPAPAAPADAVPFSQLMTAPAAGKP